MIALNVKELMDTQTQTGYRLTTVDLINELAGDSYCKEDMYEFIETYGEDHFYTYYVKYVQIGEEYSYAAVDTFIEHFSVSDIDSFEDSYRGQYSSPADYAEQFVSDCYSTDIPTFVEINWEATFDNLECVFSNGFVFDCNF